MGRKIISATPTKGKIFKGTYKGMKVKGRCKTCGSDDLEVWEKRYILYQANGAIDMNASNVEERGIVCNKCRQISDVTSMIEAGGDM